MKNWKRMLATVAIVLPQSAFADAITFNDLARVRVLDFNAFSADYVEFRVFENIGGTNHAFLLALSSQYTGNPNIPASEPLPTSLIGFDRFHALHLLADNGSGNIYPGDPSHLNSDNNSGNLTASGWAPWANGSLTFTSGVYSMDASGDFQGAISVDPYNALSGAALGQWTLHLTWTGAELPTGNNESTGLYTEYDVGGYLTLNYTPVVSAIPEPETYAMLLGGLGLLGFHARRRQLKEAAAA